MNEEELTELYGSIGYRQKVGVYNFEVGEDVVHVVFTIEEGELVIMCSGDIKFEAVIIKPDVNSFATLKSLKRITGESENTCAGIMRQSLIYVKAERAARVNNASWSRPQNNYKFRLTSSDINAQDTVANFQQSVDEGHFTDKFRGFCQRNDVFCV